MKRSMRTNSVTGPPQREERPVSPTPPRAKGKDSFSIRSLSPTGSFFGRKKQKDIRQSLRGNSVDAGSSRMTTLRSSQPPPKAARQKPAPSQIQSRFKSRFVDSDDSDDEAPRRLPFRSRFADSDDEDDEPLAPVRGIPRRQGQEDGDSTDLEDSDDQNDTKTASRKREKQATPMVPSSADIDKAMDAARKKLGTEQTPAPPQTPPQEDGKQGQMLTQGSLRKPTGEETPEPKSRPDEIDFSSDKKRRTFMGSILRRNRSSQKSVTKHSFHQSEAPPMPSSPLVTQRPPTATASPITPNARPQSPTSPGKLTRRSSNQPPRMKRGDSTFSTATAPPMMGQTSTGEWPLPAVPKIPDNVEELKGEARPATSDGTPGQLQRSASGHNVRFSEPPESNSKVVYSARTGKKKKFGMLRRAFGLND
ncbi:uncharacterized protein MYCFIDRAFT_211052 [Pseudocercospora fijiensis CIRAD86]|uniref:Uncharacterized protein n=1 Tax=Pseudocercospora fijiensis (strain CIRAD86) TaxID=383855 RepID=M2Z5N2_PSEFD|nr:uncharacterized protein MYCFIDRAFT_211052 [Pseudocercospora fijiensis CIRAD86]EME85120.1 hypothetical protein MYCFIDRAFT_211052 [Pseudocercospora fijiensis CIRAD86]